jgi:hypothetical protein
MPKTAIIANHIQIRNTLLKFQLKSFTRYLSIILYLFINTARFTTGKIKMKNAIFSSGKNRRTVTKDAPSKYILSWPFRISTRVNNK